jgi:hypothetical protein
MKFTYSSGQRPLDGFTLKRGIGRGGFGEVYFAVSDGGKEVALKLVRGDTQIELRGVAQCLNLKHPNLVNLYDLRTDHHGDRWVVMEYIAGEPLNVILNRHPNGLPRELAREWFLGLARAVAYLHDHGIVHRDLKPANIFLENGMVKVGDYGLSKAIGSSQRTAQTHSVGTVHYMAPEISTGNYGKQIDTYAAGIILYEMLTGRVPFDGESSGEILMKHLTTPPDLSQIPTEYLPVLSKALAKNPSQRYASMTEMARAVEAIEAGGAASVPRAPSRVPAAAPPPPPKGAAVPVRPPRPPEPVLVALPAVSRRAQVMELCGSMLLVVLFTALGSILWTAIRQPKADDLLVEMGRVFFPTVAACWAILVPSKFWTERRGDSWLRRFALLAIGGLVGVACWWMDGGSFAFLSIQGAAGMSYFSFYALAFFAMRWWRLTARRRAHRFSFAPILGAGFWGLVLMLLLIRPLSIIPNPGLLILVLAMTAAIVQLVSPWEQPPAPIAKRLRLRYA